MDIAAMSIGMSQAKAKQEVGVSVLKMAMDTATGWKGNPFLDKITPNKNIPSKYCLSC